MTLSERDELLDALLDGSISDADLLRIDSEMLVDPIVRDVYYRRLQLNVLLEQFASEGASDQGGLHWFRLGRWGGHAALIAGLSIGLAASLLCAVVIFGGVEQPHLGATSVSTEASASGFEPNWQIMNDGRIFFSVKIPEARTGSPNEEFQHVYFSPPVWNASLSGRWIMLNVIYDVDKKCVTHFMNGKSLGQA